MDDLINDAAALVFEAKDNMGDGVYIQIMNKLKQMHQIKNVKEKKSKVPRTIDLILKAWINNEQGRTRTDSFTTGNGNLYSYNVQIGYTRDDLSKCVVDHTAKGLGFVSVTTSSHVGKAIRYCNENGILLTVVDGNGTH